MFSGFEYLSFTSPESLGLARMSPKSIFFHFPDEKSARSADCRNRGPFYMSLAGEWLFQYYESPKEVPDDLSSISSWTRLPVPSCWDMKGFDRPHYTNVTLPWSREEAPPPLVPEKNPTGVYRRSFTLPETWKGKRVFLAFDGAESVVFATLNGKRVGFTKDSRTGAEFEVTTLLQEGENILDVIVIKWSDACYVEDQDQWWHGGLVRNVYLYAANPIFIGDFFAATSLENDYKDGLLSLELRVNFRNKYVEGYSLEAVLFDREEKELFREGIKVNARTKKRIGSSDPARIESDFHKTLENVSLWSAEDPYLYTLLILLKDEKGVLQDVVSTKVGFRSVEIKERSLLINGQRVLICGVNRHEHDPNEGRTLSMDLMEKDVILMKQYNINAVRCSHYPPSWEFLEMCDKYGLYVMDEANIETHAFASGITRNPAWGPAFLDRGQKMVMRDKNHPSIFCWSMGNESGNGPDHAAIAGWIRDFDKSRILHYEAATWWWIPGAEKLKSDIISPMYAHVESIIRWAENFAEKEDRPMILCEYSHAMGNSNGGLADYFKAFRKYPALQGGFIWEFLDHGIYAKDQKTFLYGGDFGDTPNDCNFVADGLCSPDRIPHPAMEEYKYLCQKIAFSLVDAKSLLLRITNENYFTDLSGYDLFWEITCDGKSLASGAITKEMFLESRFYQSCTIDDRDPSEKREGAFIQEVRRPFYKPCPGLYYSHEFHNTALFRIPFILPECETASTLLLNVRAELKEDTLWAKKGHITAYEQFELPFDPFLPVSGKMPEKESASLGGEEAFYSLMGETVLAQKPSLNILRATTDNDGLPWALAYHMTAKPQVRWHDMGLFEAEKEEKLLSCGNTSSIWEEIITTPATKEKILLQQKYTMEENGTIKGEALFSIPDFFRDLPRLGLLFTLDGSFGEVEYFGCGPFENYADRKAGAKKGLYKTTVDKMYTPYIMPQEFGNRSDVKFFSLYSSKLDTTLLFYAPSGVEFSVSRYSYEGLEEAKHTNELVDSGRVFLKLDYFQRGVGSASCGPDANEEYRTQRGDFLLRFKMKAVKGKVEDPASFVKRM